MSLFGSLMGDVEDDPFFGSHMRHMRQMNNMMNSLFSDPFGMMGEGPLSIMGMGSMGSRRGNAHALMPYMPQMPSLNRLFSGDLSDGHMGNGSSFSSSTIVMSSGLNGNPQVYSSSSSTKIGPNGIKETRKTLQDSRTGVKKMSIGHHIGERAHVIEREQNVYSGDAEERQEFINLEEEEAEDFDREFQERVGSHRRAARAAITGSGHTPRLALPPAPSTITHAPHVPHAAHAPHAPHAPHTTSVSERRRPHARRPLRPSSSPLALPSSGVREVYGGAHPQRRHKHRHRHSPTDTNTH